MDPICCCGKPECQVRWRKYYVRKFLRERNVVFEYLNVYDEDKHPICRVCGKPYIGQDGKRRYRHYCNEHAGKGMYLILARFNWRHVADVYLNEREWHEGSCRCEACGEYAKDIQVHHKVPVHTLDHVNYQLCWDLQNLVAVCVPCHGKKHHNLNLEVKFQQYAKLDDWVKGGK